jgi:murein L,D-transpeptidase YafK
LRSRRVVASLATACFLALALASVGSCSLPIDDIARLLKTGAVHPATFALMDRLDMDRAAPIVVRIYKEDSTLEVWKQKRSGDFALLKAYPICRFSGKLGPKLTEGDRQAPEGFYEITPYQLNPLSREYLAFNVGFPNAFDRSLHRTGSSLMVHGGCRSIGCYAMSDYEMEEIYGLLNEAFRGGQQRVQLQAFPFRMTLQNLARHARDPNAPFWTMLKAGSDAFLAAARPPTVAVCDRRYVFNSGVNRALDPTAPCPHGIDQGTVASELGLQTTLGIAAWSGRLAMAAQDAERVAEKRKANFRVRTLVRAHVAARHLSTQCRFRRKLHDSCFATAHLQPPAPAHHEKHAPRRHSLRAAQG